MEQLADGLWQLSGFPKHGINEYLIGDVLVDAGAKLDRRHILKDLKGHEVNAHALTHAHVDHQGASKAVCETLGVPFWVGTNDADAAEDPRLILQRQPRHPINNVFYRLMAGPGHPVDRKLVEGDEVGGFTVLDVPGHSAGHVAFWRESDRALVLGDVLNSMHVFTAVRGLREPPTFFTPDSVRNRESARRLGQLEPKLVCFGHGPPERDTKKFVEFCAGLPV